MLTIQSLTERPIPDTGSVHTKSRGETQGKVRMRRGVRHSVREASLRRAVKQRLHVELPREPRKTQMLGSHPREALIYWSAIWPRHQDILNFPK